jgi:ornithine cyclodeaminase
MLTLVMSRSEVARHMQALRLIDELRQGVRRQALEQTTHSIHVDHSPHGTTRAASVVRTATMEGIPAYAVVVRTEWPNNSPAAHAVLMLHESASGRLLAVMDAVHLAALRSALMGVVAADVLARPEATSVAVLGSGSAASSAIKSLRLVRSLERVWLHEPFVASNVELAFRLQTSLSTSVKAVDSAEEAVVGADIVMLTGGVALPTDVVKPGTHLHLALDTVSARTEKLLPDGLFSRARICSDGTDSMAAGHPVQMTLAQALEHPERARESAEQITIFASRGPAVLDLIAAWHVYESAAQGETLTRIDLEG